jgi:high affinity sulfate transporter 1
MTWKLADTIGKSRVAETRVYGSLLTYSQVDFAPGEALSSVLPWEKGLADRARVFDGLPLVATLRGYRREWARPDIATGLVLATMLVPQGMAYAELTGLPAATGIYTTVAALFAYSVFGPNRSLVLGPDSSLAPVIAAVVLPLAAGDRESAVLLASAMSVLAGLACIATGYIRLGVITELLSKPIRIGYLNGIAVLIFVSQIPVALGFTVEADSSFETVTETVRGVFDGRVVVPSLLLSAACVIVILGLNRVSRLRPGVFVAAAGSILAVVVLDLGLAVVGNIPRGLPPLTPPWPGADVLPELIGGALAVAVVSFADTGALSTATSLRSGETVDPNSEIKALGAANLLSGFFQGFATSASSTRTAVALSVGGRTQLASLIAAVGVLLIVVLIPGLVSEMPEATLAAIVVTAAFALFDWEGWMWLLRVRRSEFLLSLASALAVLFIGVLEGIGVAIALSLANFVRKEWRPHSAELGKVVGIAGYHDRNRHPEARVVEGLLIIRYDAPLFFANAPNFARRLQEMLRASDRHIDRIVVVGNAITDVDSTGAEILVDVLDELDSKGIEFVFAGLKGPVKDRLRSYGLYERIGAGNFYPNTISAVEDHVTDTSRDATPEGG